MAPLPVDAPGRVALILGGNGITGTYLIEHLLKTPEKDWKRIIAVSRRPPLEEWLRFELGLNDANIKDVVGGKGRFIWISADLVEETLDQLKKKFAANGVSETTHVFWAGYIQAGGVGSVREREANAKMYEQGVRAAVELAKDNMRRVILQCGGKGYGPHRRSVPMPLKESMPPHEVGADFYLDQRDSTIRLQKECNNSFDYTVTIPGGIFGFTRACTQSLATTIGLYLALKAYLKEPAEFPGTKKKYGNGDDVTCAALLAEFNVWCATTPECGGEVFNIVNAGFFSYRTLWPILTREFGCLPPSRIVEDQKDVYSLAKDIAPRASAVWKEMCGKYRGLDPKAIEWATFDFLDFALWGNQMVVFSMVKARKFGWTGVRDTEEMFLDIFARMRKAGALPPPPSAVQQGARPAL